MGLLSGIGKAVKSAVKFVGNAPKKIAKGAQKLVTDPGDWAKNALKSTIQAAPALAIPGVGGLAGAALGRLGLGGVSSALGGLAGKAVNTVGNIASKIPGAGAIKSGVSAIGRSPVGQAARSVLTGGEPLTLRNLLGGGGGAAPPGGQQQDSGIVQLIKDKLLGGKAITPGNVLGAAGGAIKSGVGHVVKHPELALAGANAIYGAQRAKQADELRKKAIGTAEGSWNERAPLRAASVKGMLNTTRPDLSSTFNDPTNPFSPGAVPRAMPAGAPRALAPAVTPRDPGRSAMLLEAMLRRGRPTRGRLAA